MKQRPTHHAFMTADVLIAIAVIGILASVLAVGVTKQVRGSQHLADGRAAMRLAESTITALQTGQAAPTAPDGFKIAVTKATDGGALAPGCAWAHVEVTGKGRTVELTGVVRAAALKGGAP